MWWQILPPLAVMGACVGVMWSGQGIARYVFHGKPFSRQVSECTHQELYQKLGYKRDYYMVGNVHDTQGFEALTDAD